MFGFGKKKKEKKGNLSVITIRVSANQKAEFLKYCKKQYSTPSQILRKYIDSILKIPDDFKLEAKNDDS